MMKRCIGILAVGAASSICQAQATAPHQTIPPTEPIDIYFDFATATFTLSVPEDNPFYKAKPPGIPVKLGPEPIWPPPPPPPPPPPAGGEPGGIIVGDDAHCGFPDDHAGNVTQVAFVFSTTQSMSYGVVTMYANDPANTELPMFAGGAAPPHTVIEIPPIPYPAGVYRLHIYNLDVRIPSPHAWVGVSLYNEIEMPILGIAHEISEENVGTSEDEFAWTGWGPYEPGLYYYGEGGPRGDMILSLHGTSGCAADVDGSGFVDIEDFIFFIGGFEAGTSDADFDGSAFVDFEDFTDFVLAFEEGC